MTSGQLLYRLVVVLAKAWTCGGECKDPDNPEMSISSCDLWFYWHTERIALRHDAAQLVFAPCTGVYIPRSNSILSRL